MKSKNLGSSVLLAVCLFAVVFGASTGHGQTPPTSGLAQPAKPAEQVYKDIQVLKGTPADQLMPAMQFMNIALGVQCEHCHLPGTYEAPNSNKTRARQMIQMQFELTKGIFDDVPALTCWTCHRGSIEPPTLPPLATGATPVAAPVSEQRAVRVTTTPEQVFAKWVSAAGGAAALQKVSTRVQTGTISFGAMQSPIEVVTKAPDKRLSIVRAPDGQSITAFDGRSGWLGTVGRGAARAMSPEDNYAAMLDAALAFPATAPKIFTWSRMWRPEKINGHDTNVVLGGSQGQPDVTLYFDKDSGLLLRITRYVQTPVGRLETQIDYDDYRTQDGVKIPFRWTVARPETRFTIQIDRVQLNVPIDDARFTKPAGIVPASEAKMQTK
jgi:photosynthetic reaction center cytochrome c subunit